ncbi:hypothetical protein CJ030_MR3G012303 [Morella rubra]|uniref:Uncharacterized protein n=1 Tax=Morella rubra TaxID=262757 RepID=A0A6A1W5W9_9ROSI|nr:hypothetical protein CJ030_MR3G012303 [Morella rubra]
MSSGTFSWRISTIYNLLFEDQTLPEVGEKAGWLSFFQRTDYASKNMVQEFYAAILRLTILEEPSMKVTIYNVLVTFLPDELVRFLGYERNLTTFSNLPQCDDGRPTKAEIFQSLLGQDVAILEGSNMQHRQLLPFWRIVHLILYSAINSKKHTTELSYDRAEFLYLVVVYGELVYMASYIYQTVCAEAMKTDSQISLSYGILLT